MLETMKAHEGDLVELTEDLPKYDLKHGQRGFVIEAFEEPNEAYDIEFEDEDGEFLGFAYSVKPNQIRRVDESVREASVKTVKAKLLDIVELTEDLPKFGLQKGERGAVVVAFDNPDEAYDLEFVDESGKSRFAYAVKPGQIKSPDEILREEYEQGMGFLNDGKISEAEKAFKRAIELKPECIGNLHNSILEFHRSIIKGVGGTNELQSLVAGLRFVLGLDPNFEMARHNIAIVYLNYGVQKAREGDIRSALEFYYLAIGIELPPEIISCLRANFAAAYTSLSIEAQQSGDLKNALAYSRKACEVDPNETTRNNLGAAYTNLASAHLNRGDFQIAGLLLEYAQNTGLLAPELYNNYGVTLAAVGNIDGAIQSFKKALDIAPGDITAKENLLNLERAKRQANQAVHFSQEAIVAGTIPVSPLRPQPYQMAA